MTQLLNYIEQTDSTNNRLKQLLAQGGPLPNLYTLYTFYQTAGRGQQGNSWESEQGKNLLFSTLILPQQLPAAAQFRLSMLAPLAIVNVINRLLRSFPFPKQEGTEEGLSIKWPNDIYIGNRKLAGILIENTLEGNMVATSVVGIGLNVNQTVFHSDAPNPVSLKQITSENYDLHLLMQQIMCEMHSLLPLLMQPQQLKSYYMQHLYRAQGFHPYIERVVSVDPTTILQPTDSRQFLARITDIDDNGSLCLTLPDNSVRHYHFKQIRFVIPNNSL